MRALRWFIAGATLGALLYVIQPDPYESAPLHSFLRWPGQVMNYPLLSPVLGVLARLIIGAAVWGVTFGGVAVLLRWFAGRGWFQAGAVVVALVYAAPAAVWLWLDHTELYKPLGNALRPIARLMYVPFRALVDRFAPLSHPLGLAFTFGMGLLLWAGAGGGVAMALAWAVRKARAGWRR